MKTPTTLLSVALLWFGTGCATIFASRTATLAVTSDPTDAEILMNGAHVARTPNSIEVSKRGPEMISVAAPGRSDQMCPVSFHAGAGYIIGDALLCVFLFPLGCISFVDSNGAWNELDNSTCRVGLRPPPPPPPPPYPYYAPPPQAAPPRS